mgnify:CR=1 FL=1
MYDKQWKEERNELVQQMLQRTQMERDTVTKSAQEEVASMTIQKDAKEQEVKGIRAELLNMVKNHGDAARHAKEQHKNDEKNRELGIREYYEGKMSNITTASQRNESVIQAMKEEVQERKTKAEQVLIAKQKEKDELETTADGQRRRAQLELQRVKQEYEEKIASLKNENAESEDNITREQEKAKEIG